MGILRSKKCLLLNNMTRKLLSTGSICIIMAFCFAFVGNDSSIAKLDGGPPYNTNAPSEKTCSGPEGTNACHSGGIPDNSGPGSPTILFSGGSVYVPGQTYTVTARIAHPVSNTFGFQIVSLRDNNNLFAGSAINLLDTAKTRQQQPTWGPGQDRIFIMHRIAGVPATTPNVGQWSYEWTAPLTNQGNISFYACFNAGNGNNLNDSGDETYWAKITISPSAVGISSTDNGITFSTYPNPANEVLHVEIADSKAKDISIGILNLEGKIVKKIEVAACKEEIDLRDMEAGVYFVLVNDVNNKLLAAKKMLVQH